MGKTVIVVNDKPAKPKSPGRVASGKRCGANYKNNPGFVAKQFKKGDIGNPAGRPRGSGTKNLSGAYEAYLQQIIPDDQRAQLELPEGATWADAIAIQVLKRSLGLVDSNKICFTAITELREVTEGKIPDRQEVSGRGGAPLPAQLPTFQIRFKESPNADSDESKPDQPEL